MGTAAPRRAGAMAMRNDAQLQQQGASCWETQATEHSLLPRPELEVVTEVSLGKFSGR